MDIAVKIFEGIATYVYTGRVHVNAIKNAMHFKRCQRNVHLKARPHRRQVLYGNIVLYVGKTW